jgi:two-component system NarL family sensor kinase
VGMGLQAAAAMTPDQSLRQRLEATVDQVDAVIRDLRNYIFGLRPGLLADRALDQALRHLAEDLEEKSGVTAVVEIDPQVGASLANKANDVVQLAAEALSNVARHSGAQTCRVSLSKEDGRAVLSIEDDGTGFDPKHRRGDGQGLRNLTERAAGLGGEMKIESVPDEGTTVRFLIPL